MGGTASDPDVRHRERACPRDWTPLVPEKLDVRGPDVTIDRCPTCQGVFLDKNELARITGDTKLNKHLRDRAGLDSDSKLLCPHCGGVMDLEHVAGVAVEVCLTCYGLWLDKGEMEALKARPNVEAVERTVDKDAEIFDAKRATKRTVNPLKKLDRGLDEFVRRYL